MLRSGAEVGQPTYTPTWVLYKDLTFLEDIIKLRKTVSNYKSNVPANSQVSFYISSPFSSITDGKATVPRTTSSSSSMSVTKSDISSWNSDLCTGLDESSIDVSESFFSPSATPPTPSVAVISKSGNTNAIAEMQRTISNIDTKRKVSSYDSFATKKKKETDAVNKCLIEQSKELTDLTAKIGQSLIAPASSPSARLAVADNALSSTQSMVNIIAFALSAVAEHAQLECLIGVLQYTNTPIYIQKFSKTD